MIQHNGGWYTITRYVMAIIHNYKNICQITSWTPKNLGAWTILFVYTNSINYYYVKSKQKLTPGRDRTFWKRPITVSVYIVPRISYHENIWYTWSSFLDINKTLNFMNLYVTVVISSLLTTRGKTKGCLSSWKCRFY